MAVRRADEPDLDAMVELSAARRADYARLQPVFWRQSADAREKHRQFLRRLITADTAASLVHETSATVDGFAIGMVVPSLTFDEPRTYVCMVDDAAVAASTDWPTVGAALLETLMSAARARSANTMVVICGHGDTAKADALRALAFRLESAWHVREHDSAPIDPTDDVQAAIAAGADAIHDLAATLRADYQRYQPSLWRRGDADRAGQIAALAAQLTAESTVAFVHRDADAIDGFAIGTILRAPPVYDPGGPICLVEDALIPPGRRADSIERVVGAARDRGAVLTVVISGEDDLAKLAALESARFRRASDWYVRGL